jgi:hypothetical protein
MFSTWITELGRMILVSLYVAGSLGDWLINNVVHKIGYNGSLLQTNFPLGRGGAALCTIYLN